MCMRTSSTTARRLGVSTVVDTYGVCFPLALAAAPDVVKLNCLECEQALGLTLDTSAAVETAVRRIRGAGAGSVAITFGSRGMVAAWDEHIVAWKPPSVRLINPIGAGDAMTAGIIDALSRDEEPGCGVPLGYGVRRGERRKLVGLRLSARRGKSHALAHCRMLFAGSHTGEQHMNRPPLVLLSLSVMAVWHLPLAAQTPPGRNAEKPWFERSLVGMEVGPTGAQFGFSEKTELQYCSRFNGHDIVRHSVAANVEYLVIWARDGDWAYYNSQVAEKCPGLGARDVLRETMDEAARHQLPVIAYCVVQQGGNFLAAHPEYQALDASGKPAGRFCYNSGYLEVMKKLLAEQLAYGIAGFHIDMLDQGFGPALQLLVRALPEAVPGTIRSPDAGRCHVG